MLKKHTEEPLPTPIHMYTYATHPNTHTPHLYMYKFIYIRIQTCTSGEYKCIHHICVYTENTYA